MLRTENVELTVLCLIRRNNNYLLQNRLKDDWKDLTLPGGHIEKYESIIDAVVHCIFISYRRISPRSNIIRGGRNGLDKKVRPAKDEYCK